MSEKGKNKDFSHVGVESFVSTETVRVTDNMDETDSFLNLGYRKLEIMF